MSNSITELVEKMNALGYRLSLIQGTDFKWLATWCKGEFIKIKTFSYSSTYDTVAIIEAANLALEYEGINFNDK